MKLPSKIIIVKSEILDITKRLEENSLYLVSVSFHFGNPAHRAILATGFSNGAYTELYNNSYDGVEHLTNVNSIQVLELLRTNWREKTALEVVITAPFECAPTKRITYSDLAKIIAKMSYQQQMCDVTVEDVYGEGNGSECFAGELAICGIDHESLEDYHPVIRFPFKEE